VNISQLVAFVQVVERGSFSAAARELGVSQPAVTMQVQGLESTLGVTLLDRAYRKVELTEAGRALLPHARRVLVDIDSARREIAMLAETVTGRLSVAASTTPGQYLLPRILGRFLTANPEVNILLTVADTADVVEAVLSGRAHLGMVGAAPKGARVEFERLGTDEIVMICPVDHPFAQEKAITAERVAAEPFILREEGSGTRQIAEEALSSAGIEAGDLHVVTELGTGEAIVNAVEGGMGLGMVSSWVAEKALKLGTVATVNTAGFPAVRPLYLVTARTTPTRAASEFVVFLRTQLAGTR